MATMNPRHSRNMALLVLAVAVLVIVGPIAFGVWSLNHYYDTQLSAKIDRIDRFQRIASTRAEVVKQLDAMRAKDPRKFFLRSGPSALSAAEAQEAVRTIVESNGGKLITMQAPVTREEGRYRMVSVNVQLTANIFALRKILDTIDASTPFLFVDNLMVRSQVPGSFRPQPGQEPEMFVQFDLYGYSLVAPS